MFRKHVRKYMEGLKAGEHSRQIKADLQVILVALLWCGLAVALVVGKPPQAKKDQQRPERPRAQQGKFW